MSVLLIHDGNTLAQVQAIVQGLCQEGIDAHYFGQPGVSLKDLNNSSCIVVCVTKKYVDTCKQNSETSNLFQMAYQHKAAHMVFITLESEMTNLKNWTGPVGLRGVSRGFVDLSSPDSGAIQELVAKIHAAQ
eukprot:c5903_g1_i1.p1 GENE.c5903_g1_i1~~c5903_g1_i1.p1  ORF type:complete len:132 (-),score=21.94 c5903_g1_i1:2-397(-)